MPAPATCEELVDLIHQSGLVDRARLDEYLQQLKSAHHVPSEPPRLAARLVRDGLLTNFQAQQLLKGRFRNFIVGKYRILEPLGAGGMSKVFLAEHLAMGHRVAMKLLPIRPGEDDSLVPRFEREAKAVGALNHPNIVRAHDIDGDDKYHYIIMDFIDGVTLHDLVRKRGPLDPVVAAHYVAQAAEGLQHIHESGLIHRDIKPANLLVDRDGMVKILDMGLARFQHDVSDTITQKFGDSAILGTADFLAPEQARQASDIDIRADIYGLGATFYFLLAGQAPFEHVRNFAQKLMCHQMRPPEPLASLRSEIPAGMIAVCECMLAKTPEERFQSPIDVASALTPWIGAPIPPPDPGDMPQRSPLSQSASSWSGSRSRFPSSSSAIPGWMTGPASRQRTATDRLARPSAAGSATPVPRRHGSVRPHEPDAESAVSNRLLTIAAGAMLAVGILVAATWWWQSQDTVAPVADEPRIEEPPKPPPEVVPTPPPAHSNAGPLFVDELGGANTFTSLSAAIAAARPGDRILIRKPLRDSILLTSGSAPNLSIEPAEPGTAISWSPAGGQSVKPLLVLSGYTGLLIKGIRFDGRNESENLIRVEGECPGCSFDQLELAGFTKAGIRFTGTEFSGGAAGKPLKVSQCRFTPHSESASGIAFDSAASCGHIAIEGCRFEGPAAAGLSVETGASDVSLTASRFFNMTTGVRIGSTQGRPRLNLSIANNTFVKLSRAIQFDVLPDDSGSHLSIVNNLFVEVPVLANLSSLMLSRVESHAKWIWSADADPADADSTRYFRQSIELPAPPTGSVTLDLGAVDSGTVWFNGEKLGESGAPYFDGRIRSYDVGKRIRPGRNTIAVEVIDRPDPLDPGRRTQAGLFTQLTDRSGTKSTAITISDGFWKVSTAPAVGWETCNCDDSSWPAARPTATGDDPVWKHIIWDSEVRKQLETLGLKPPELEVAGNIRDLTSWERWPSLGSARAFIEAPGKPVLSRDPTQSNFLLYPVGHPLQTAGANRQPCGAPPQ